jgi:Skp family chaperone for outer membrane proteins
MAAMAALLSACGSSSPIGLVDVQRVVSNWPEYQTDQNQLYADERTIAQSKASNADKQREALALQIKYAKITDALTAKIKQASQSVAESKQLKLVLTREGIGYGGVDITRDVEKAMNITESSSPSPSP